MRSKLSIGILAAAFSAAAFAVSAEARTRVVVTPPQGGVQVGLLECQAGQSIGYVFGSTSNFQCVFRANGRRPERYVAQINRFGLDLGVTEQTRLAWSVFSPTRQFGPGDLSGDYGGVQGSATVGVGAGANLLVGGSANSFAMQPLSVQGQTGLSVSAGIAGMQLRPAN